MKKEIKNLTQKIFREREFLIQIGFSEQESEIFHRLIHGESITDIAVTLNLSPYQIRKTRNQKFHLIPILMHQKLALIRDLPLKDIYQQLFRLDAMISESMNTFRTFHIIPIQNLHLSKRAKNALIGAGIKHTNQLCQQSPTALLTLRNIGTKTILEIEIALEKLGLKLSKR